MARIILLLAILLQAWIIRCTPANYTIDDTTGDARAQNLPFYLPQGSWSNNCTECDMQPEAQNASNGTYTQTRDNVNISNPAYINIDFEGTAIYLFFILGNELPSGSITTNITIRLDRQEYTFSRNSTQGTGFFEYDQLVFAKDTLPNTNHTLSIDVYSVLAFDRAVYT
ncbi:hypothetical protein FA15DRAFT_83915 [Coprinopsis marcescibilis]|uniref:Uncharacterized protein n=1 Tax=Coprinopsis marcescibilis TaxID=230819 RepID=A0A5C3KLR0_COPMA|nr:hypothetical protein FA15DRAFT_83915 [Coprinopsis marcescibilis]